MRISEGALAMLHTHVWPSNIRELKSLMQYVAAAVPADVVSRSSTSSSDSASSRPPPPCAPGIGRAEVR